MTTNQQYRDEATGRILPGGTQPAAVRARISAGQAARHARQLAEYPHPSEGTKRCNRCKAWKPWSVDGHSEFQIRKRKNKNGTVVRSPAPECRACSNERTAAWRERERESGRLSERQRKWNESRDLDARRTYQREWQALDRRRKGAALRGPWKRYRDDPDTRVPVGPFREWVSAYLYASGYTRRELARRADLPDEDMLTAALHRETIQLELVDRVLIAAGYEGKLRELYPPS
jgi:hypothetical protein